MPVYEYRCQTCGCQFALTQKVGDPEPQSAPVCAGSDCKIQKLYGRINSFVVGAAKAPPAPPAPLAAPAKPDHICSKYCEHHK
jgi:putative FmdB family regulatory protein